MDTSWSLRRNFMTGWLPVLFNPCVMSTLSKTKASSLQLQRSRTKKSSQQGVSMASISFLASDYFPGISKGNRDLTLQHRCYERAFARERLHAALCWEHLHHPSPALSSLKPPSVLSSFLVPRTLFRMFPLPLSLASRNSPSPILHPSGPRGLQGGALGSRTSQPTQDTNASRLATEAALSTISKLNKYNNRRLHKKSRARSTYLHWRPDGQEMQWNLCKVGIFLDQEEEEK